VGICSEGRRTADLPEDIARLGAIDNRHRGITCRGEGAAYSEDEHAIGVALAVQCELSGQLGRALEAVHSGRERQASEVLPRQLEIARLPCGVVICDGRISLRLGRNRVARVYSPNDDPGWEAGHCASRAYAKVAHHVGRTCICYRAARQNAETACCSQWRCDRVGPCVSRHRQCEHRGPK
jgi:hypothetical protein